MNPPTQSERDLYQLWMRIKNKLSESENLPRKYGVDISLTPCEIHTIQAIGDHPESNVRAIAGYLGITPGAASQNITKLAKRDLVTKVRGLKNEKEVHLQLTSKGFTAYQAHETVHEKIFLDVNKEIGTLEDDDIALLRRVLQGIEKVYEKRIQDVRDELNEPGSELLEEE